MDSRMVLRSHLVLVIEVTGIGRSFDVIFLK